MDLFNEYLTRIIADSDFAHRPIPHVAEDSAAFRQINKPIGKSYILDSLETVERISLSGPGTMTVSDERPYHYINCIKITSRTTGEIRNEANRSYSSTGLLFDCGGTNLCEYNRISFWAYPDCPGFRNVWIGTSIKNDGVRKVPCGKYFENMHFANLANNQWNHIIWEIPYMQRDKVIEIKIAHNNHGSLPSMGDEASIYYSRLEAQTVEADNYEGWDLGGKIAFCHSGYRPGDIKKAISGKISADDFFIKNDASGLNVYRGVVEKLENDIGIYSVMDFSPLTHPGKYRICVGGCETKPFYIDNDAYKAVVWKLINFFCQERCGASNDAHSPCHLDCYCVHPLNPMLKVPLAGGWHDAGDLSQGRDRTADVILASVSMAMTVKNKNEELYRRLSEEARWGLDWLTKTRFGDGYHAKWATIGIWTKNITGDEDDIAWPADNSPFTNLSSAYAEASAALLFKDSYAKYSEFLLKCAKEDFAFAMKGFAFDKEDRRDKQYVDITIYGQGVCAAVALYNITKDYSYINKAAELARIVIACQQADDPDWEGILPGISIKGFFYADLRRMQPMAYDHLSHEHTLIQGLSMLCECMPGHDDYAMWLNSIVLFGEYIKSIFKLVQPYGILPAAIYMRVDSIDDAQNIRSDAMRDGLIDPDYNAQVVNGIKLSDKYYLRRFPVSFMFRGFHGTLLTKAKAVSAAAKLLRDKELAYIAQKQIEWVLGNNPFALSSMYGEGYDFPPLFSEFSFDITGAIPAGFQTLENNDAPYYPMMNCCTYKEIWVNPASRLMWILSDLLY